MKINNKDKVITGIITLFLVFAIFSIGYLGIQSISNSISNSNSVVINNATGNYYQDTGATVTNILLPLLIIGAICLMSSLLFYSVSSTQRFSRFGKVLKFLISTTYYFGYGVVFIVILAVPSYLIYMLYNFAVVEGNTVITYEVLKWVLIATGAFFGIGGIGYLFKKYFVDKLKERLGEIKTEDKDEERRVTTL